jgi:homoaconitase/3-isopropylmalate dehydratase large subunit
LSAPERSSAASAAQAETARLKTELRKLIAPLHSDLGAEYAQVIELDAAEITPMVATPGDPGNGKYIRDLPHPVPIEIAYGGTCTAGKNEDMDMYAAVLADALKRGKRVSPNVAFWIQFGSQETREYSRQRGYIEIFERAGIPLGPVLAKPNESRTLGGRGYNRKRICAVQPRKPSPVRIGPQSQQPREREQSIVRNAPPDREPKPADSVG